MLYETQIKVLIPQEKYDELTLVLPRKFGDGLEGKIEQIRFRSGADKGGDLRLRELYSTHDSIIPFCYEIILKEDKPKEGVAAGERREKREELSREQYTLMKEGLLAVSSYHDPAWTKLKRDFIISRAPLKYKLSLQEVIGPKTQFGYVVEATIKHAEKDNGVYRSALVEILDLVGLKETPAKEFMTVVDRFRKENL